MTKDEVMRKLKHQANLETVTVAAPKLQLENGESVCRRGQLEYKVGRAALLTAASMSTYPKLTPRSAPLTCSFSRSTTRWRRSVSAAW